MAKEKPMRLAVVTWGDAWSSSPWETRDTVLNDHKPTTVFTCGWVVKHDKTGITLSARVSASSGSLGEVGFIPRGMIQKVEYVARHNLEQNQ